MLIYLHGVSSSGKSTIANELLNHLENAIVIDQDTFYKKEKPIITFQGDKLYKTANWDTAEAIDFIQFNQKIKNALNSYNYVIVTGFALRDVYMQLKADVSILLNIGDEAINKITKARLTSKGYKGDKAIKDYYMVEQVVLPYYQETLKNITYQYIINVFDNERRLLNDLVYEVLTYLK